MAKLTLYRKYRPQSFAEIVNQDHVKTTIQQEIVSNQLPHAFLFYGPRGIGKTTTARILAKSLNCPKRKEKESEPCNACESCEAMTEGKSLSLVEVDAASQTGVDNVRENIIANARVAVKGDEFKVFIIDEVHMLSTSSFNALLKTLEEPPERVIFILATTEIHKIPETIISRCQRFDFHPVAADILLEHLQNVTTKEERAVDEQVLRSIVKKSSGHVRDAMSLLSQVLSLPGDITPESASMILPVNNIESVLRFFAHIEKKETKELFVLLHELEQNGMRPLHFCQDLIEFAHQLLLFVVGSHPDIFKGEVSDSDFGTIQTMASGFTEQSLLQVIDVLMKRRLQLKDYDQGKLPLELAVIQLTKGGVGFDQPQQGVRPPVLQTQNSAPPTVAPPANPVVEQAKPVSPPKQEQPAVKSKPAPTPPVQKEEPQAVELPKQPVELPKDIATYEEVNAVWKEFMGGLSNVAHSHFIVLRTSELRRGDAGEPVLAFRFQMHHDHIKSGMHAIVEHGLSCIPDKKMQFTLVVDEMMDFAPGGDVEELKEDEKEEFSQELNQLADAFGGSVME